jgi:hypothetical protein
MRGAAAEDDSLNRRLADDAGFSGAVVDLVDFLEIAWAAVGVAIVSERAASVMDCAIQNCFDASIQSRDFG